GQRLALVERDVAADRFGALARELGDFPQYRGAIERRGFLPALERALRGFERAVQIFAACVRQLAEHFTAGGGHHRLGLAAFGLDVCAVYVECELFVPGGSFRWICLLLLFTAGFIRLCAPVPVPG